MIATDALLVIAFCLAILAAIGIRNALSLRDIGLSLEKVASALETSHRQPLPPPESPAAQGLDEAEVAAAIAAAARAVGRDAKPMGRK